MQIAYAMAIGFAFMIVFYKSGSLWTCIIAHSIINATSNFAVESSESVEIIISIAIIIISGGYALYLSKLTQE